MNINYDNRFSFHDSKIDDSSVAIIEFIDKMNCITERRDIVK